MVEILAGYPTIHQTFNLVPSCGMLRRSRLRRRPTPAERRLAERRTDVYWEHTIKPAADLSPERTGLHRRAHVRALRPSPGQVAPPLPGTGAASARRRPARDGTRAARLHRRRTPRPPDLVRPRLVRPHPARGRAARSAWCERGRDFREEDKRGPGPGAERDILAQGHPRLPEGRGAPGRSSCPPPPTSTPSSRCSPTPTPPASAAGDTILPHRRFAHPEDAWEQVRDGVAKHERVFGARPRGMWCSEQSVGEDVLPLLMRAGIRWTISDQTVLSRSLSGSRSAARCRTGPRRAAVPAYLRALPAAPGRGRSGDRLPRPHPVGPHRLRLPELGLARRRPRPAGPHPGDRRGSGAAGSGASAPGRGRPPRWSPSRSTARTPGSTTRTTDATSFTTSTKAWRPTRRSALRDDLRVPAGASRRPSSSTGSTPAPGSAAICGPGAATRGTTQPGTSSMTPATSRPGAPASDRRGRPSTGRPAREPRRSGLAPRHWSPRAATGSGGSASTTTPNSTTSGTSSSASTCRRSTGCLGEPVPLRLYLPVFAAAAARRPASAHGHHRAGDRRADLPTEDGWDDGRDRCRPIIPRPCSGPTGARIVEARFGWGAEHLYLLLIPRDVTDLEGLEIELTVDSRRRVRTSPSST